MALLVLLGCGLFLIPAIVFAAPFLQLVLVLVCLSIYFLFRYNPFTAFLVFTFLYPFLPSQSFEALPFDYLEFLFLCFAFWWALGKVYTKKEVRLLSSRLTPALAFFLLGCFFSAFLVLLKNNYLFSEVFLLNLKDHWNIFIPQPVLGQLGPIRAVLYSLEGILFFYITLDIVNTPERVSKTTRIMSYAAVLVCVVGILQYFLRFHLVRFWVMDNPNLVRINATFSDPNSLGTYLSAVFCFGVFAYLYDFPRTGKKDLTLLAILLFAMVLTASRAAWTATVVCVLVLPAVGRLLNFDISANVRGALRGIVRYGFHVAFLVLIVSILSAAMIDERDPKSKSFLRVLLFTLNPRVAPNVVLKGRLDMWGAAIRMFEEAPVFGVGLGNFGNRITSAPFSLAKSENAHNYFLQILAEGGLVVFFLFILMIVQIFRTGAERLRSANRNEFLILYGLFAGLVAILLTSFTGHPLLLLKLQFLFWSFAAMLTFGAKSSSPKRISPMLFGTAIVLTGLVQAGIIVHFRHISAYEYGYYAWEKDLTNEPFRWTSSEGISVLEVRGRILQLQLRQLNPDVLKQPFQVKIYLNDQLLDTVALTDTDWKERKYFLPDMKQQDHAKLRILPQGTFVPRKFGNDTRNLGIEVRRFVWLCSGGEQPIGVYEREEENGINYYWTQGQASFPVKGPVSKLSFSVLPNSSVSTSPVEAQLFWNDMPLKRLSLDRLQWKQVDLDVPDSSDGELTIRVSRTANPKRMGQSMDVRELGVRVTWPFQVQTSKSPVPERRNLLEHPRLYAISNVANRPFRLLAFSVDHPPPVPVVLRSGLALPIQPGWLATVQSPNPWVSLFSVESMDAEHAHESGKIRLPVNLGTGYWLLRVTAKGYVKTPEVPVARVAVDNREIARQPILSGDWKDYYLNVELGSPGKELLIELVNDTPGPADKSLFIREVLAARKEEETELPKPGWELSGNNMVIAEPIDNDILFGPENYCYAMVGD